MSSKVVDPPILNIIVVGFHHKKGCQVEFSYPPLIPQSPPTTPNHTTNESPSSSSPTKSITTPNTPLKSSTNTNVINECPKGWKYLPTLALPDGSHNFIEDSVFFNLPSLTDPNATVYGISCYRQIPVEKLKIRTADVTRSTVQKSVCVLASVPLYGYIEVKLSLIAHAFFEQGDFSNIDILVKAYKQLNVCLTNTFLEASPIQQHIHVGLPLRDIILKWRYKSLILFKLLLLERKSICFGSPVRPICSFILAIASLHPKLLEDGFQKVACVRTSRPMSPMPTFNDIATLNATQIPEDSIHPERLVNESPSIQQVIVIDNMNSNYDCVNTDDNKYNCDNNININKDNGNNNDNEKSDVNDNNKDLHNNNILENDGDINSDDIEPNKDNKDQKLCINNKSNSLARETSIDSLTITTTNLPSLYGIEAKRWGAPLTIFSNGNLCLPYLSLPYMDLLTDSSVQGYTIGTSNILFRQKKQLTDVLIDVENGIIDIVCDMELRKQLTLTTEDLRFVDFIIRHVQVPKENAEGSEQWIRQQFQGYMTAMLRTILLTNENGLRTQNGDGIINNGPNTMMTTTTTTTTPTITNAITPPSTGTIKDIEHFNGNFISAFRNTNCYQEWLIFIQNPMNSDVFNNIPIGHPFAGGTFAVTDMKLKIAQTMNNSESGRKINQAVNTTSRAVGGALSQAKGAFSNWWSSMVTTTPSSPQQQQQNNSSTVTTTSSPTTTPTKLNQTTNPSDDSLENNQHQSINNEIKPQIIYDKKKINNTKECEIISDDEIIIEKIKLNHYYDDNPNNMQLNHSNDDDLQLQNEEIIQIECDITNKNVELQSKVINTDMNFDNKIPANNHNNNIIEMAKEASDQNLLFDTKHNPGEIFTV